MDASSGVKEPETKAEQSPAPGEHHVEELVEAASDTGDRTLALAAGGAGLGALGGVEGAVLGAVLGAIFGATARLIQRARSRAHTTN